MLLLEEGHEVNFASTSVIFYSSCNEKLPIHDLAVCEVLSMSKATDPSHTVSSLIDHSSDDPPEQQILENHNFIEGSW